MKIRVEHSQAPTSERSTQLVHVHHMVREVCFALELVGIGLLALSLVLYVNGGGDEDGK